MSYLASKIFWLAAQPLSLAFLAIVVALVLGWLEFTRLRMLFSLLSAAILFVTLYTSAGTVMLQALENHIGKATMPSGGPGCIIVLGGSFEAEVIASRGGLEMNQAGDRFVEALRLAQILPGRPHPGLRRGWVVQWPLCGRCRGCGRVFRDFRDLGRSPDPGDHVANHVRECREYEEPACPERTGQLPACDLCLPHAARDGSVWQGGIGRSSMADRLSYERRCAAGAGLHPAIGQRAANHDSASGMDRPSCLLPGRAHADAAAGIRCGGFGPTTCLKQRSYFLEIVSNRRPRTRLVMMQYSPSSRPQEAAFAFISKTRLP